MTDKFTEAKLAGIALGRLEVENHLASVFDTALDLINCVGWYYDDDPKFGGPPSPAQLAAFSQRLTTAYVALAVYTGLDPCEQLHKRGLTRVQVREKRKAGAFMVKRT